MRAVRVVAATAITAVAMTASTIMTPATAYAATWWWNTTTTGLWSDGANWSNAASGGTSGTAPTSDTTTDIAFFNQSSVNGTETIQLNAAQSIAGMVIANTGSTSITSDSSTARLLTLGLSGVTVNAGAGVVTLGDATNTLNLAIAANSRFTNNSSNLLRVLGNISRASADTTSRTLVLLGTGTTVMSGVISNGGGASGNIAFNTGTSSASPGFTGVVEVSGANTFTGGATLNGGTVRLGASTVMSSGTIASGPLGMGTISLPAGTGINVTLSGNDSSTKRTINNTVSVGSSAGTGFVIIGDGVNNASVELASTITNNWQSRTFTNNLSGSGVFTLSGTMYMDNANASRTITFNGPGNTVLSGVFVPGVTGTTGGAFTYGGSGTTTLSGSFSYTGATTLSGSGTVILGSSSALGQSGSSAVTIATNNTLQSQNDSLSFSNNWRMDGAGGAVLTVTIAGPNSLGLTGTLTNATQSNTLTNNIASGKLLTLGAINLAETTGGRTLTLAGAGNTTIGGVIANGTGAANVASTLTITNSGTTTLNGANTYTGATNFNTGIGTVVVGNSSAFGSGGTVLVGGTATLQSANDSVSIANNVTLSMGFGSSFTVSGQNSLGLTGTLTNQFFSNVLTNNIASGKVLTLGAIRLAENTGGRTFTLAGSGNTTIGGVIVNGTGASTVASAFTISNSGTTTLNGANTYTGVSTLSGGVVTLGAAETVGTSGPLGSSAASNAGNIVLSGGTLRYSSANQNDYSGRFSTAASQRYNVDTNGQTVTWATSLSSSGGSLAKSGSGTLVLSGSNSYSGTTAINAGSLNVGSANSLAGGGNLTFGGGSLQYSAANTADYSGRIKSSGSAVSIDTNSQTVTFGSVLDSTNTGGLAKLGSGTLSLTAANTYSGPTTAGAGVLRFNSLASSTSAQALGAGSTVNLGVANTSAGEIDYFAATSGTLDKNVFALGNGRNRIRNSGSGTLTLSGTLTKDATILELAGGTFRVTGQITGSSANSDLYVNGASVTLTNTNNNYNGPTYVYGDGTLTLGASNVIPDGSALLLGGTGSDAGTGSIVSGTFTDTIASFTTSSLGGTVSITGSGATMGGLTMTGNLTYGAGTDTLNLSLTSLSLGKYSLLTYQGTRSGTFDTVTGLTDSRYTLVYGGVSNGSIDLQMKADQATTFTMTTGTVTRALVNSTVALSGTITNSSPVNAAALSLGLGSTGQLTVSSFTSGSVAAGSSSAVSGSINAGSTLGSRTWSVVNTDSSALTTTSTATGSLTVVADRTFTTPSIAFGRFLNTTSPLSGTSLITSTGLSGTTANSTIGSFGSSNGLTLSLTGGTNAFTGLVTTQTATYTTSGSYSGSLGGFSGSFAATATNEFSGTSGVTVAYTGTAVQERTYTSPATINLGRVLIGGAVVGSGTVTSTQSFETTATGTLGSYSGGAINGVGLSGAGGVFNGSNTSATYSLTGNVSGTAGQSVGGTFYLASTNEFGTTTGSAANVSFTGTTVAQRQFSVSNSGTINLGNFLRTASVTGSTTIESSGLYATTASATLDGFSGTNTSGFSLALATGTNVFDGGSAFQQAVYSLTGSATSAGVITGGFLSSVSAETGTIAPVAVALTGTALDQAIASFSGASPLTVLNLDFGQLNQGIGNQSLGFSLFNIEQLAGFTADLALLTIVGGTANTGDIWTNLAAFNNLAAGGSNSWLASISTDTVGSFLNTYTLSFKSASNGSVFAGDTTQTLTLTVQGVIVVPEPGSLALAAVGLGALVLVIRRRR